jgi:hypothetical protein
MSKKIKKANTGITEPPIKVGLRSGQFKRLGRLSAKDPDRAEQVGTRMVERATRRQRGKKYVESNLPKLLPQKKTGGKVPTSPSQKKFASLAAPKDKITYADKIAGATMRTGGKTKKCRYGCK